MRNRKASPHDNAWNAYSTPHQDGMFYAVKRRKRKVRRNLSASAKARMHETRIAAKRAALDMLREEQARILAEALAR